MLFQRKNRSHLFVMGIAAILGACASPERVAQGNPPTVDGNRGLATEKVAKSDSELSRGFNGLSEQELRSAIAREFAESFAYGQNLLIRYDRLLAKKHSLQKIMRTSSVYAELQALYFLNHELEEMAADILKGQIVKRLGENRVAEDEIRKYFSELREEIRKRNPQRAYGVLALANIEESVRERLAKGLGETSGRRARLTADVSAAEERAFQVMSTAKALKKDPEAYRTFLPRKGEKGASIVALVQKRGAIIRKEWAKEITRKPQSQQAEPDKVVYPDAGKAGNIFGSTFPKGVWALTFDDGPHGGTASTPSYTRQVLANLRHHEVPATFFVLSQHLVRADCTEIGDRIRRDRPRVVFPELAEAARDAGHAVESHSYYHSEVPKDNDVEQTCEIRGAADVLADKVGARPLFYRLPYGSGVSNAKVREKIAAEGMIHVHWSVDTLDWQDRDPDSIVRRTMAAMKLDDRGIILFHDIHPQSVIASEKIMAQLKDPLNRWEPITIPEAVDRLNSR